MMYTKINLAFIAVAVALVGCGKIVSINPKIEVSNNKTYFIAEKYGDFSNLYSFNFSTRKLELLLSRSASGDSYVFQKMSETNTLEGIYFAERFMGKPSRVTFFQTNYMTSGQEHLRFPENTYDIVQFNNKLIAIGFNKGEILAVSPALEKNYFDSAKLKKQKVDLENFERAPNTSHLLTNKNKIYALSIGGYTDNYFLYKPHLLELSEDFKEIVKKIEIPNCFNPAQQVKIIDSSKVVLNCNPYKREKSDETNLVFIDISSENIVIKEMLRIDKNNSNTQQFQLGGVSADKKAIFISERRKTGDDVWNEINTAYWYDLNNPEEITVNDATRKTEVTNLAGNVIYNYANNIYLFDCVRDGRNSSCLKGKAALSESMSGANFTIVDFFVPGVNAIKFPLPIYP